MFDSTELRGELEVLKSDMSRLLAAMGHELCATSKNRAIPAAP